MINGINIINIYGKNFKISQTFVFTRTKYDTYTEGINNIFFKIINNGLLEA